MIVHCKLKVTGPPEAVEQFHRVAFDIDSDYPYAGQNRDLPRREFICSKCGGKTYSNPRMNASDLKKLAQQCGARIKVKQFALGLRCEDDNGRVTFIKRNDPTHRMTVYGSAA